MVHRLDCVLLVGSPFLSMGCLTCRNAGKEVPDFFLNGAMAQCNLARENVPHFLMPGSDINK